MSLWEEFTVQRPSQALEAEVTALRASRDSERRRKFAAKREAAELHRLYDGALGERNALRARAEQAEAERDRLQQQLDDEHTYDRERWKDIAEASQAELVALRAKAALADEARGIISGDAVSGIRLDDHEAYRDAMNRLENDWLARYDEVVS